MYGNNNYNYVEQKPHVEILQLYTEETTIINPKHTSTSTFPKNIRKIQTQYRFGFAMPGYLVEILFYSSELNLIIVDSNFLKCYAHNEFCMNLFNHPSFHMASTHNKVDLLSKFRQIFIDKDISWSILPSNDSELVVLNYRYVENFYKNVTISIIDFDDTNKNYFLLKREDGYPTIAVRKYRLLR
uniref:Uncharacterized protein n=1 Tax=Acrobeloides nanus TaxID=290746 RepID=A0A914DVN7_9BILA